MFSTAEGWSQACEVYSIWGLTPESVWHGTCINPSVEIRVPTLFRDYVTPGGRKWLPLAFVMGSIAIVAYADYITTTVSLGYLYILPLAIGAMFLRSEISYGLVAVCIFLHDLFRPAHLVALPVRIAHNLTALVGFVLVVYAVQRYVMQRELLARTVRKQRDDLVNDVQLAAQVQRMFLPHGQPSIAGLDIAGMMQPARGVGGDYYDYIPMNGHAVQMVVADAAGNGVSAALLMSAAAAATQLEINEVRDISDIVGHLNAGLHSVSDGTRYVTLLLAEVDASSRSLRYVNCGHNPALLLHERTGEIVTMSSSCSPLGMFAKAACEVGQSELSPGDVMVFYTDGLTEAENPMGEPFGMERLLAVLRGNSALSAERIMKNVFHSAVDFHEGIGFDDDVTILVVKCNFDGADAFVEAQRPERAGTAVELSTNVEVREHLA
jgi:serine phosphatase RsbU (regulator of sigma subunit)